MFQKFCNKIFFQNTWVFWSLALITFTTQVLFLLKIRDIATDNSKSGSDIRISRKISLLHTLVNQVENFHCSCYGVFSLSFSQFSGVIPYMNTITLGDIFVIKKKSCR